MHVRSNLILSISLLLAALALAAPAEMNVCGLTALAQTEYASHDFVAARDHAQQLGELEPRKTLPYHLLRETAGYSLAAFGDDLLAQARALFSHREPSFAHMSAFAVLGLGLVFGLKHATEVDHVIAVSNIVSEQRKLWRAAIIGGLWGLGHTASLVIVGAVVLVLRVAIPERVASGLEFCVALMIIGLGVATFLRSLRARRAHAHLHQHRHDGLEHAHLHFHEGDTEHAGAVAPHSHAITRIGIKPLIVGAMHGLAGSAALTLLVLAQIPSPLVGLLYLLVFGLGSIAGMLLMSGLVGLPFVLSARKLSGVHHGLQTAAGALSICFGLWYAYETQIPAWLLGMLFFKA